MHVLAPVAEFERSVIRERINAGLAAARERGTLVALARCIDTQAQLRRSIEGDCRAVRSQQS